MTARPPYATTHHGWKQTAEASDSCTLQGVSEAAGALLLGSKLSCTNHPEQLKGSEPPVVWGYFLYVLNHEVLTGDSSGFKSDNYKLNHRPSFQEGCAFNAETTD